VSTVEKHEVDLSSIEFWARPLDERLEAFRQLRAHDPVSWHRAPEPLAPGLENSKGFWAVTRYAHVREVSRNPQDFSSAEGVFLDDFPQLDTILSFLVMDDPRHTQMRGIVHSAFSPGHIRRMEEDIVQETRRLVGEIVERGEGDLCELFFKQLPGRVFAGFLGVEEPERREALIEGAEQLGAWADPTYSHIGAPLEVFQDAARRIMAITMDQAGRRRSQPRDDLVTWVVQAEFEGEKMSEEEIAAFFTLLVGAANDTTRHAMAHAVVTLQEHPDQRALLLEDFEGRVDGTVEELLRFKPPLMHFRRTATSDVELGGQEIHAGDKVVLWYLSANRDEDAFENPDEFDIMRDPNRHLAFGGGGPHYCLGSALGRHVTKAALREVTTRMRDLDVGEPEMLVSNFMNGVLSLPARWTPA
jgi:cytochrome P450